MLKNTARRTTILIFMMFLLTTFFSYGEEDKKVVLILVNEVNFEDLKTMKSLEGLINNGSIALMNTKTSTTSNIYKAYTTIGSGVRAEGSAGAISNFNIDEKNKAIYTRRTGLSIGDEGIVNLDIAKLIALNEKGQYGAVPGALGQSLHEVGIKTAAIGNGDTEDGYIRLAPAVAMDAKGYVDFGEVQGDILKKNETYPFGLKTDYKKLMEVFQDVYEKAGLVVIDIADMGRVERYKDHSTDEMYLLKKDNTLKEADALIGSLLNEIDLSNTRLMLVTPYPSSMNMKKRDQLTPVIIYGDGVERGILISDTTRRPGIIGNVDIAPSIAQYLGAEANDMTGKAVDFIGKDDHYHYLMNLNEQTIATSKNRYPVLSTFAIFEILVSIMALVMILIEDRLNKSFSHYFKNILLSTMTVPFVLLILPIFHINSIFTTFVVLIMITFLITYITKRFSRKRIDSILILSFLTTIGLLLDLVMGAQLIKNSLLGYDPIIGARYYGIGNEYMGVLIGAVLVFVTAMIDRLKVKKIWAIFIFIISILIMGYPKFGANVGGTITAVAAFTFTSLRLFKIKIRWKQLILIGVAIIIVVGVMGFIDITFMGSKSHLAGAIQQIIQGGPAVIFMIIKRKMAMNLRLIGITIWSKVLITTIIIFAILFYRPVGTFYKLVNIYPNLAIGWSGIVMACIVGFLVNDSGVVAAATGIIFLAMSMLYLTFFIPKENS